MHGACRNEEPPTALAFVSCGDKLAAGDLSQKHRELAMQADFDVTLGTQGVYYSVGE